MGDQHATDVLKEIVALADDPNQTLESVAGQLEALYGRAEDQGDQRGMQLASAVYDGCLKLHEQMGTAVNIATAAREIAQALQEQRDEAAKEIGVIREMNPDHLVVQDIFEVAADSFREELYESGVYVSVDPAYDITTEAEIPCSYDTATMFHNIITCYCPIDGETPLPLEIRQEIADFMAMIVKKAQTSPPAPLPNGEGEKERTL